MPRSGRGRSDTPLGNSGTACNIISDYSKTYPNESHQLSLLQWVTAVHYTDPEIKQSFPLQSETDAASLSVLKPLEVQAVV